MESLFTGNERGIGAKRKVDSRHWYQVRLERSQVTVQAPFKPQTRCDAGDSLSNEPVESRELRFFNVHVSEGDIVHGLIIHHESHFRELQHGMGTEH